MNTDTALLGQFMKVKENESVLDIGTNNGALLLYASQYTTGRLIGVEVQKEACEMADMNLKAQNIADYVIIHGNVCEVDCEPVDVVVCNPPYFKVTNDQQLNVSAFKRIARHECYLTLEQLCASASRLLKEKGRFYLVHRAERLVDICTELRKNALEVKTLQLIRDIENEQAHGVLVEAVKQAGVHCTVLKEKLVSR